MDPFTSPSRRVGLALACAVLLSLLLGVVAFFSLRSVVSQSTSTAMDYSERMIEAAKLRLHVERGTPARSRSKRPEGPFLPPPTVRCWT
jgi:hypothetical protein